jgi:small multidrug resistance family-3 protein
MQIAIKAFGLFFLTALAEIFGCYAFYMVIHSGKPRWWIVPGMAALVAFAWLLTLHSLEGAGRVYAAYGGIYIVASLAWLRFVERTTPDRWDVIGAIICLTGASIIYFGPRATN